MKTRDYEYGATDTGESIPNAIASDKSSSSSATLEQSLAETSLPLHHHQLESQLTKLQTPDSSMWATPNKSGSTDQGENTPATAISLGYDSSDSSFSPSRRGRIDKKEADEIRLSINFEHAQFSTPPKNLGKSKIEVLVQIFGPKFVLEVMGGAGAVWGFSEAIGLRTSGNLWFWRPVTLFAGTLFFIRWCRHLQEFIRSYDDRARKRPSDFGQSETTALMFQENA